MELEENVERQMAQAFGMDGWRRGQHDIKNAQGEIVENFYIFSYWTATISGYYDYGLEVCVIQSDKGCKGLLLIPPIFPPLNREFGGPQPRTAVEMKNWDDPVMAAAAGINLFPKSNGIMFGGRPYYVVFRARTHKLSADLFINQGPTDDPTLDNLWNGINSTINRLAKI